MLRDSKNQTLAVAQGPSLPDSFKLCLDLVKIDPVSITCGSAVFHTQDRVSTDIGKDPAWAGKHEVAAQAGIKAAWSFLIHGTAKRVIGTLDVYPDEARAPTTG